MKCLSKQHYWINRIVRHSISYFFRMLQTECQIYDNKISYKSRVENIYKNLTFALDGSMKYITVCILHLIDTSYPILISRAQKSVVIIVFTHVCPLVLLKCQKHWLSRAIKIDYSLVLMNCLPYFIYTTNRFSYLIWP